LVLNVEPKSYPELREHLWSALPPDSAARLAKNDNWSASDQRYLLEHLLPVAERAALSSLSDPEIGALFHSKILIKHVRIRVTESSRGMDEQEVELTTGIDSCGITFQENESYLVYASRDTSSKALKTGACSGTQRFQDLDEQLQYLRGLKTGETQARVFGFVTRDPTDMQFLVRASKPAAAVPLVLRSGGRAWQTATDSEGNYELAGLQPGSYEISAGLPNLPAQQTSRQVELSAGECSRQAFLATPVGRISGKLLDFEGHPVLDVLVELEAVPLTEQPRPYAQTEHDGGFVHESLPAGQYLLGFNLSAPPNAKDWYAKRVPYARSYYPGVTDRAAAQVLRLEAWAKDRRS
jgi:hypothetical protein